jgi:hypothetical protein
VIDFDDYPLAQFRAAFRTLFGRIFLILLTMVAGAGLGGLTATRSSEGILLGIVGFIGIGLDSIFFGVGIFVFPIILIYTLASIRFELPLWLGLICTILMWWNFHLTIRWTFYDSPMAKRQNQFKAEMKDMMREAIEKNRREEAEKTTR